jgi:hypothetical protein
LLKKMALSPAHYFHAAQQPQDDTIASRLGMLGSAYQKRADALRFGTAVHATLLGDPTTIGRYSGRRDPRTKAWQDFQAAAAKDGIVEILNDKEHAMAMAVATALRRNDLAMRLLCQDTVRESKIEFAFVGKSARATPDARGPHLVDLKTAVSSEPSQFARVALRLFYHAQLWLYGEAMETIGEKRPVDAYIVAVEKTAPWPVSILRVTDRALEVGEMLCRGWIERLNVCEATGQWPEYLSAVGELDIWEPDGDLGLEFNGKKVLV